MATKISGFPPIAASDATMLILGTMPSVASLQKQQYYGHPRNAFWPMMVELLAMSAALSYEERAARLKAYGLAVWDVLQSCHREGSLDADIDASSIEANDFAEFFTLHSDIRQVFFNGGMAERLYRKHVLIGLPSTYAYLRYQRLPSTSPAFASLSYAQKLAAWKSIKTDMVK